MNRKVLKASAGTGKTYRLSLEYIAAILKGENFEEILVMTFTKKATAEIRVRIFQHLALLLGASGSARDEIIENLKKLYPDLEINEDILKNSYEKMLANKEKVKIYTLDSFTNMLFKKSIAPHLNIYSYEIIDDDKNEFYIENVLKKLISERKYFNKLEMFFQNRAYKNIDDYLSLIKYLLNDRWKFLAIENGQSLSPKTKKGFSDFFILFEEMLALIREAGKIKNPEKSLDAGFKTKFRGYLKLESIEEKKKFLIDNFKELIREKNFWTESFIKPTKKVPQTGELYEKTVLCYTEFKEKLARYIYDEVVLPAEEEILSFSNHVFEIYDRFKFADKKFTHSDISTYTYKFFSKKKLGLLSEGRASDYLYQLIGNRINTMFIDEFQDTSILQWKILLPLIANAKSLISVGDEKQSIYGWRGGEKKLFERLDEITGAQVERMETSFRSEKNIIEFVNRFFNGNDDRWEYQDVKHLDNKNSGYVEANIYGKTSEEDAVEKLVDTIKERNGNYSGIAVVARRKKELNEIAARLDDEKIPYITNDGQSIVEHRGVKGIYYFIKYLVYKDYFSLICFLRDVVVDVDGVELKYLLQHRSEVEEYLNGGETLDASERLKVVLGYVKGYSKKRVSNFQSEDSSIKDTVRSFFEEFGITEKFNSNSDLKNIYYFYQLLRGYNSLDEFIYYVEENKNSEALKQLAVEESNALKLMTIHKSKGLEFDTEFFYFKESRKGNFNNFKFYIKFSEDYTCVKDYLLCFPKYKDILDVLGLDFESEQVEKEELEEINNFYVALTRPKKNLFIFMDIASDLENSKEKFYINGIKNALELEFEEGEAEYFKSVGTFVEEDSFEKVSVKVPVGINKYFSSTRLDSVGLEELISKKQGYYSLDIEKENKRKKGLAMHYYLEFIKYNTDEERELATKMTLFKYGNMFGKKNMARTLDRIINFLFNDEKVLKYDIFNAKYKVYTEYEIVEKLKNGIRKHRLDRLNIDYDNKYTLIIDYKTGESKDQRQLEDYKLLVRQALGSDYQVDGVFLEIE